MGLVRGGFVGANPHGAFNDNILSFAGNRGGDRDDVSVAGDPIHAVGFVMTGVAR